MSHYPTATVPTDRCSGTSFGEISALRRWNAEHGGGTLVTADVLADEAVDLLDPETGEYIVPTRRLTVRWHDSDVSGYFHEYRLAFVRYDDVTDY